ncbi:MAG: hypothetical protein ACRCZI_00405 [Cetobacterium sp.]
MGEAVEQAGEKPRSAKADIATGVSHKFEGLEELAGNVFISGVGHADKFRKTTEAIAIFTGRTIMNKMHMPFSCMGWKPRSPNQQN